MPDPRGQSRKQRQETPLERLGRPEDVAESFWFLASPNASFITGGVLNVSGGFVI